MDDIDRSRLLIGPSIFNKFLIKFSLESLLNKLFSHEVKPNLLKVIKISLKNGCSSQSSMLEENFTFPEISQNSHRKYFIFSILKINGNKDDKV